MAARPGPRGEHAEERLRVVHAHGRDELGREEVGAQGSACPAEARGVERPAHVAPPERPDEPLVPVGQLLPPDAERERPSGQAVELEVALVEVELVGVAVERPERGRGVLPALNPGTPR